MTTSRISIVLYTKSFFLNTELICWLISDYNQTFIIIIIAHILAIACCRLCTAKMRMMKTNPCLPDDLPVISALHCVLVYDLDVSLSVLYIMHPVGLVFTILHCTYCTYAVHKRVRTNWCSFCLPPPSPLTHEN
jgi:hypothetical protein